MINSGSQENLDSRKLEEMNFHDQRERDEVKLTPQEFSKKYANRKFYSISRKSRRYLSDLISETIHGHVALNYCCGTGGISVELAQAGAYVHGIDISPVSISVASERVEKQGVGDRCEHRVMDAENLEFSDDTFDIIVCSGVLHHLDLTQAFPELARVLKPSGRIICDEPLKFNPIIHLYRRLTPHMRTSWEVEHILGLKDFRLARKYFRMSRVKCFSLMTILAVPLRNTGLFKRILSILESIDGVILSVPGVRLIAWVIIFELTEPKKVDPS